MKLIGLEPFSKAVEDYILEPDHKKKEPSRKKNVSIGT
jgi:hypothetical protein